MKRNGAAFLGMLLAVVSAVAGGLVRVQAAESPKGRIEVVYLCGGKTEIQDAEFSVLQIADARVEKESVTYTLKKEYRDGDKNLPDPMTPQFRENEKIAEDLLKIYQRSGRNDAWIRKTDSEGRAVFTDCPAGIYLIWQSGGDGESAGYETSLPFLAEVPFQESSGSCRTWERKVYPKTAAKPETGTVPRQAAASLAPEEEPEPVTKERSERGQGTGDESRMAGYFLLAAGAAAGLFLIGQRESRKRK